MNKREIIERALEQLIEKIVWYYRHGLDAQVSVKELIDALAEQVVIECEVEHTEDLAQPYTAIVPKGQWARGFWDFGNQRGHFGTPGKALAIIIPLEGENDLAS